MKEVPKSVLVVISGAVGLLYILNPTMGLIELIPDNFPVIGNLDEALATLLIVNALAYFGIDFTKLFDKDDAKAGKSKDDVPEVELVDMPQAKDKEPKAHHVS